MKHCDHGNGRIQLGQPPREVCGYHIAGGPRSQSAIARSSRSAPCHYATADASPPPANPAVRGRETVLGSDRMVAKPPSRAGGTRIRYTIIRRSDTRATRTEATPVATPRPIASAEGMAPGKSSAALSITASPQESRLAVRTPQRLCPPPGSTIAIGRSRRFDPLPMVELRRTIVRGRHLTTWAGREPS
jgi:hypothetical protein